MGGLDPLADVLLANVLFNIIGKRVQGLIGRRAEIRCIVGPLCCWQTGWPDRLTDGSRRPRSGAGGRRISPATFGTTVPEVAALPRRQGGTEILEVEGRAEARVGIRRRLNVAHRVRLGARRYYRTAIDSGVRQNPALCRIVTRSTSLLVAWYGKRVVKKDVLTQRFYRLKCTDANRPKAKRCCRDQCSDQRLQA